MDQAQLLSIIGSLYDKLVTDVAAKVIAMQPKQEATPAAITADAFVTHLDNQEWFWSKLQTFVEKELDSQIDVKIEEAISDHTSEYDHDDFVSRGDVDFVSRGDVESVVSDEVDNRDIVTKDEVEDMIDDKLGDKIDDKINEAIDAHTSEYDHNDFVEEATVDSKIEDALTAHTTAYHKDDDDLVDADTVRTIVKDMSFTVTIG